MKFELVVELGATTREFITATAWWAGLMFVVYLVHQLFICFCKPR